MCAAKLSIPKQYAGQRLSIGATPEDISHWLDSLSEMELEPATGKLLAALVECNRIPLNTSVRYHIMMRILGVLLPQLAQLESKYIRTPAIIAKPDSLRRIETIKRLLQEAGIAFKIMVSEFANREDLPKLKEQMACAIYHAATFLARYQVLHYQVYEPIAGGVWGELNLLYRQACQLGIEDLFVGGEDSGSTIDKIYKAMLLMSLLNPYRLLRGDVHKAYDAAQSWSHLCKLETRSLGWEPNNDTIIDLAGDRPPEHIKRGEMFTDLSMIRVVNTSAIDDYYASLGEQIEEDAQFTGKLLQCLVTGRLPDKNRRSVRRSSFAEMELVTGLDAAHAMFVTQGELDSSYLEIVDNTASPPSRDTPLSAHGSDGNEALWHSTYYASIHEERKPTRSITPHVVRQADVGMGGYGLKHGLQGAPEITLGDLVCVRMAAVGHAPWRLGDVRWMSETEDHALMFGVRLLAETAYAFYASLVTDHPADRAITSGLLVPADGFENPAGSLILPAQPYRSFDHIEIWTPGRKILVRLTARMDGSDQFSQFSYQLVDDR